MLDPQNKKLASESCARSLLRQLGEGLLKNHAGADLQLLLESAFQQIMLAEQELRGGTRAGVCFTLRLVPESSVDIPPIIKLRKLLKDVGRNHGLRCVDVQAAAIPAANEPTAA